MANVNSKSTKPTTAKSDDDFQKGVPYAKADPYTGPANVTMRRSRIVTDSTGNPTEGRITGGLKGESAESVPIPRDQFKRGGTVQKKVWHGTLAQHQQRQKSRTAAPSKPKGNW